MGGTKGNGVERSQSDSKVKTQELFRFIHSPNCCCVCELLSHVKLFVTLWTVARQSPLSMGFSRQEYWSGFYFLLQGIFLTQGTNPGLLHCRQKILYRLCQQGSQRSQDITKYGLWGGGQRSHSLRWHRFGDGI